MKILTYNIVQQVKSIKGPVCAHSSTGTCPHRNVLVCWSSVVKFLGVGTNINGHQILKYVNLEICIFLNMTILKYNKLKVSRGLYVLIVVQEPAPT